MRKLNVNTAMPRPLKPTPQAKRVAPPAVPEIHRHSGSSFGSTGYASLEDGGFTQTRDSPAALTIKDDSDFGMITASKSPSSLNAYMTPTAFTFPISTRGEPLTHKAAVYYHQQLALQEDQGIDLTQSPGRDSPGSSSGSAGSGSRHSTASLDSGRASSYITGGGASTRGALSSPRCSVSSCSIGSCDRMSQRSDNDVILDWLVDLKFEEYAQLFSAAGYDMPTIARMTPEDLTAIGIKNPQHRERIKQHIDNLQLPDGLPNFVPGSIEEWLRLLRLEEYIQPLLDQNYKTVRDVTQVTWEDLEDIGIVKLGHQKKILLAIKRVKDIISGKWNPKGGGNYQQDIHSTASRLSWDESQRIYNDYCVINHENNEIVLIKIRQPRGKSLESLEDISECNTRTHLTFSHYSTDSYYFPQQQLQQQQQQQTTTSAIASNANRTINMTNNSLPYHVGNLTWRRSYDDGDITPTNEIATDLSDSQQGGGTLPRQRSSTSGRSRIIERSCSVAPCAMMPQPHLVNATGDYVTPENAILMSTTARYGSTCSPLANKKRAPEPPRRQCSIRNVPAPAPLQETTNAYDHCARKYLHYDQLASSAVHNNTRSPQYIPSTHQPIYANYTVQTHQTTAEIHCDKTHDTKSNSSIDSIDTIPFANENTGTIKQRLLNRQEISSSLSLSSSSSSSSTNTVANIAQSFHSIKSCGSLHEATIHCSAETPPSPTISSPTSAAAQNSTLISSSSSSILTTATTTNNNNNNNKLPLNLEVRYHHSDCLDEQTATVVVSTSSSSSSSSISGVATAGSANPTNMNTVAGPDGVINNVATDSTNVLNDIGNMLANLTDELDAMLEEEKRVGINDSE